MDFISEHRERGWHTSVCALDVAQFFPSLSHAVMGRILQRLGFSPIIVTLIESYFQNRTTTYKWDTALSKPYDFSLGTPQGDCLSPILSALYISVAIRKVFPETMPPASTRCLFYVDDGTIITASPSLQTNIDILRLYLLLLLQALSDIGLQVEASKTELIHFFAFELSAARRLAITHQPHLDFTWRAIPFNISPTPLWRYLGFFFTPSLDFSYHVQFYTNKAFSTIRACNMLGNSVRGIGPRQRAHAYQACALSVLTYGLPLWYTMWGAGVIRLVKKMERVHSYALGWITGTFRTTPIGARELIAGIPPLKIILNLRLRGITARLLSLGERHSLYRAWTLRWLPTAILHTTPRRRARHLPTDNPLLRLSAPDVQEQFMPNHSISRPGQRVVDLYAHRIFFDLSAPKRSSKLFAGWVRDLQQKITSLLQSCRPLFFSDGAFWSKSSRASYAFTIFHNNAWHDVSGWCPAGSSYDAEITALEEAIQWAIVQRIEDPIFFVDNKAVLTSFLNLDTHSSQLSSIRINMLLQEYLSSSTSSTISFAYCPSHEGVEGNERADRLTKHGAAMGPTPPIRILRSNFLNEFKRDMSRHWRILAKSQTYKGRNWIPIRQRRRFFKPDLVNKNKRRFFMTTSGNDIQTLSRMARAVTNHAPTGEYRKRFHPTLPSHCNFCGPNVEHTRAHVLFSCPQYVSLAPSFTDWKRSRTNNISWKTFFQDNPSAFTFGDLPEDVH
ncbi:hypothetical protein AX14_001506 [Amanita brunnescens Koide BX004]|nr:hypothetical protein AX14_001506 [Amanita brunnescens Koide BX004]